MHFPSLDPDGSIADDQLVVRYMKIATFLMLLQRKVFVPSLKTLKRTDPTECAVLRPNSSLLLTDADIDWLWSRASNSERSIVKVSPRLLAPQIWLRELANRRCIWCWYAKRPESMGMWNTYGAHGIAIVSRVGRVRASLQLPDDTLSSVGRVIYIQPSVGLRTTIPSVNPGLFYHPYYFKQKAYEYENEIRFVVASEPITRVSSVLYDGDPSIRELDRIITSDRDDQQEEAFLHGKPDRLSHRHEEADADGEFHRLPSIMMHV
jgi:hypothetical protein